MWKPQGGPHALTFHLEFLSRLKSLLVFISCTEPPQLELRSLRHSEQCFDSPRANRLVFNANSKTFSLDTSGFSKLSLVSAVTNEDHVHLKFETQENGYTQVIMLSLPCACSTSAVLLYFPTRKFVCCFARRLFALSACCCFPEPLALLPPSCCFVLSICMVLDSVSLQLPCAPVLFLSVATSGGVLIASGGLSREASREFRAATNFL